MILDLSEKGSKKNVRIDLNVPFHEKEQVKALGAKWDAVQKTWYVTG